MCIIKVQKIVVVVVVFIRLELYDYEFIRL